MNRDSWREILAIAILGGVFFLFVSLYTHSHQEDYLIGDSLQNACGPLGAFLSHQLYIWVGHWGSYLFISALAILGLSLLVNKEIEGLGWKFVGLSILILTFASLEVAVTQESEFFPGGYYGQFFYTHLLARLNYFGSLVILVMAIVIAILISTDAQFYPAVSRMSHIAVRGKQWKVMGNIMGQGVKTLGHVRSFSIPRFRVRWPFDLKSKGDVSGDEIYDEEDDEEEVEDDELSDDDEKYEEEESKPPSQRVKSGSPGNSEEKKSDDKAPFEIKIRAAKPLKSSASLSSTRRKRGKYELPPIDLLLKPAVAIDPTNRNLVQETADIIEETLKHFKIEARVVEVQKGPVITQYELSLAAGIKVHKIVSLADDLSMALKAESIRIVAPIPGKSTVGVEVPNKSRVTVGLRELLESREAKQSKFRLPLSLGRDIAGTPIIGDLGEMPHLLIAGSTGSGKSVCMNAIIVNLLMTKSPEEVKLILIDPKMVELSSFEEIPHLLTPVVTDMKKAPAVLNWLVDKMEERYELLAMAGVRHLTSYNSLGRKSLREHIEPKLGERDINEIPDYLPYYVVIIDELADLMMSASKEVESSITRLAQKSRAVGIHVIFATQRPSVDVITGLIKANMPCRISFHVTSKVDSRTILDRNGSEKLLGKGDMLFLPPGTSNLIRAQGTFISDKEINNVVEFVRKEAQPLFNDELSKFGIEGALDAVDEDELYEDAVRIVLESRRGSVTLLQRQLQIGYTRASRLMELMAANGLVGPFKGSKAREVYYSIEEWETARNSR